MSYAFSLMRHLLFDLADQLRFEMLESSNLERLAQVARKVKGEIKYHLFHGVTWVRKLAAEGNEESKARMQSALNESFPFALGIFEPVESEGPLTDAGIFAGEAALQRRWIDAVTTLVEDAGLTMPLVEDETVACGGRCGHHTEHLRPLLEEMTEVFRIDEDAAW